MSDSIRLSQEEIKRKIRDGVYSTYEMDSLNNQLWKCFFVIRKSDCHESGGSGDIPNVQCRKCAKCCHTRRPQVRHLTFDVIHPVVSHPRHRQHCRSATFSDRRLCRAGPCWAFYSLGRADFCINLYGPCRPLVAFLARLVELIV